MIELHPFLQVILAGLFLAAFLISAAKNSGEDDDEDDDKRSRKSRQAGDRDE
ncbi:hypothetical protein [Halomicrobium sp. LC1Hm]|uniref:hypothetical protein n=1 Tax=Halomicrobium sp. LC1Hm TaxID=2610902 RepID=UPI0012982A58|nr:hypothetical protein [Halomicrobium sp. LC1Hm]QGA82102.1 hypothetical protein LC1Hm_1042 [Halomicrobium sp. LC1Hm]